MAEQFPRLEIEDLGYNLAVVGQKTYNGVAILAKAPIEVVETALIARARGRPGALPGSGGRPFAQSCTTLLRQPQLPGQ